MNSVSGLFLELLLSLSVEFLCPIKVLTAVGDKDVWGSVVGRCDWSTEGCRVGVDVGSMVIGLVRMYSYLTVPEVSTHCVVSDCGVAVITAKDAYPAPKYNAVASLVDFAYEVIMVPAPITKN
jgi:hypothetical protein